jgi:adiponectin receptor
MALPADVTTLPAACGFSTSDENLNAWSSSTDAQQRQQARRRRHSSFIPRRKKSLVSHIMDGEDGLLLKVRMPHALC